MCAVRRQATERDTGMPPRVAWYLRTIGDTEMVKVGVWPTGIVPRGPGTSVQPSPTPVPCIQIRLGTAGLCGALREGISHPPPPPPKRPPLRPAPWPGQLRRRASALNRQGQDLYMCRRLLCRAGFPNVAVTNPAAVWYLSAFGTALVTNCAVLIGCCSRLAPIEWQFSTANTQKQI